MAPTKIVTEYYISTGKLNAMFTLRVSRMGVGAMFGADHYICNLAGANNEEGAVAKARDYFERMFDRMGGNTETHSIFFNDCPEATPRPRRGKLSANDTEALCAIEAGRFPFGKFRGQPIAEAQDGYLLYWADLGAKEPADRVVVQALSAACMGIALERDLIAKREAKRAERAEADAKSEFVGNVGERIDFEGVVVSNWRVEQEYGEAFFVVKVRCGDDLVVYVGNGEMAGVERDQVVKFKATIKAHAEYKGVKETKVNRPKLAA